MKIYICNLKPKTTISCPGVARYFPQCDSEKSYQSQENPLETETLQSQYQKTSLRSDRKSIHSEDSLKIENRLEADDVIETLHNGDENADSNICDHRKSKVSFRADTNFEPKIIPSCFQSDASLIRSDSSEISTEEEKQKENLKTKSSNLKYFVCCSRKSKKLSKFET